MIIYGVVVRGSTVLGEFGITHEDFTNELVTIISRNTNSGTRLVPMSRDRLCAVMNKQINGETISFAAIIESNQERDVGFNFLDSLADFFESEALNPKMKSEMNAFISRYMKLTMVVVVKLGTIKPAVFFPRKI